MSVIVTWASTRAKVHEAPGYVFFNVLRPVASARLLVTGDSPPKVSQPNTVWAAVTPYAQDAQIFDSNGNIQEVLVAGTSGTPTAPTWATQRGGVTADGTGATAMQWKCLGPNVPSGQWEGAVTVKMTDKTLDFTPDHTTLPTKSFLTGQEAEVDIALAETSGLLLNLAMASSQYTTGTDTGFPSGAQLYTELTAGGVVLVPDMCIAVVSPRPDYPNPPGPTKSEVFCGYRMKSKAGVTLAYDKNKVTLAKGTFNCLAVDSRAPGDQGYQWYIQE